MSARRTTASEVTMAPEQARAPRERVVDRLAAPRASTPGSYRCGDLELRWGEQSTAACGESVWDLDERSVLQVSRTAFERRRWWPWRPQRVECLQVEIRGTQHEGGPPLRLRSTVDEAAILDGLPRMAGEGIDLPLDTLLTALDAWTLAGVRVAHGTARVDEQDASPRYTAAEPRAPGLTLAPLQTRWTDTIHPGVIGVLALQACAIALGTLLGFFPSARTAPPLLAILWRAQPFLDLLLAGIVVVFQRRVTSASLSPRAVDVPVACTRHDSRDGLRLTYTCAEAAWVILLGVGAGTLLRAALVAYAVDSDDPTLWLVASLALGLWLVIAIGIRVSVNELALGDTQLDWRRRLLGVEVVRRRHRSALVGVLVQSVASSEVAYETVRLQFSTGRSLRIAAGYPEATARWLADRVAEWGAVAVTVDSRRVPDSPAD